MEQRRLHEPVLLEEVLHYLRVKPGGAYVDCTAGAGGHSEAILEHLDSAGRLLAIDRDAAALALARERLAAYGDRVTYVQDNFRNLAAIAHDAGFDQVDGVLIDLGVSSMQLDQAERGFSFSQAGPLDMRMDPSQETTAFDVVNDLPVDELADILWRYGEEHRSRRIAQVIARNRPVRTTTDLARLVEQAVGRTRNNIHPATKSFLALRVYINGELESLTVALPSAHGLLGSGGRLVTVSFHSLEDRIVKQFLARESRDCICPPRTPVCRCGHVATLRLLTKRGVTPSAEEVERNPRCRSARLRAAERIG